MSTTTSVRKRRNTVARVPKVIAVSALEDTLRSISKRSFSGTPQEERAYIRNKLRSLWTLSD